MKIVHVIFSFNTGGAETMLIDIINEQVKKEDVTLIIINDEISEKNLNNVNKDIKVILIRRKESSRNPVPIIKLNWYLFKLKPDVIHCHNHKAIQLLIKKNAVLTVHDVKIPTYNFKYYKKLFAISEAVKKDIEKRANITPIVVYNGIRIDDIKQRENYEFDKVRIVQVSRLNHEKKGHHILLQALKILIQEKSIKNITVDFIGEGDSLKYLQSIVKENNLEKHINFLGLKDRKYVYNHLRDYNLLVQPSLYEGFGLTIAEAMAAKIPVLVSNIEGPMEIIDSGKYGFWFEKGDAECLAKSIKSIYELDESILTTKINNAYEFVKDNFSVSATANNCLKNYKLCL